MQPLSGSLPPAEAMLASCLIKWVSTWYSIMSARNKSQGLSLPNTTPVERPEEFNDMDWLSSDERVTHLEESIDLFRELRFSDFGKYEQYLLFLFN
jgi:hypothetical protein